MASSSNTRGLPNTSSTAHTLTVFQQDDEKRETKKTPPSSTDSRSFDFSKLTEFNPAIVYCFQWENLKNSKNATALAALMHSCGQYKDMFDAYLYANDVVVPEIRKSGIANITPDQLLQWICQGHSKIARTLARDYETQAGEFAKAPVMRCPYGLNMGAILLHCFRNVTDATLPKHVSKIMQAFQETETDLTQVTEEKITALLKLILQFRKEKSFKGRTEHELLLSLTNKMLSETITPDEKALINAFIKTCLPPDRLPAAMQQFAQELLSKWRACDPQDSNAVTELLFFAFQKITDIHAFFNGNGRIGTWLINLILRSLGLPDIILRKENDKNDPTSSYAQAIAQIDSNPDLFKKHLQKCLQEAKEKPVKDLQREQIIIKSIQSAEVAAEIIDKFPDYNLSAYFDAINDEIKRNILKQIDKNQAGLIVQNVLFELLKKKLAVLHNQPKYFVVPAFRIQKVTTQQMKEKILAKLRDITGVEEGWAAYNNHGSLCVLKNCKDEDEADKLFVFLNQKYNYIFNAEKLVKKGKAQEFVIKLSNINSEYLLQIDEENTTGGLRRSIAKSYSQVMAAR